MKSNHCCVQKLRGLICSYPLMCSGKPRSKCSWRILIRFWFSLLFTLLLVKEGKTSCSNFLSDFSISLLQRHLTLSSGYFFFNVYCKKWLKYRIKWDTGHFGVGALEVRDTFELVSKSNWSLFCAYQEECEGKMTILSLKMHINTKNMKCPRC